MTNRSTHVGLAALGLLTAGAIGCGDEAGEASPLSLDRTGAEIVIENRSNDDMELDLQVVIACPQVSRYELVDLEISMLGPQGRLVFELDPDLLNLTKDGNAETCEITPIALGRQGSNEFTVTGEPIAFDASGQPLESDPEINFEPECSDDGSCIERS